MRTGIAVMLLVVSYVFSAAAADLTTTYMIQLEVDGARLEGAPLDWSARNIALLSRDGRLWNFHPSKARNYRKSSPRFRAYTPADMRQQLHRELGAAFEVSGTGHYLVAHPRGQRDYWSPRFEELYRAFVHYFAVRGFNLREPQFPLVAIVWKNEEDFRRYAHRDGARIGPGIAGYYSPATNRITLYDVGGGRAAARDWHANAETIIHEATHQTAFNTGVHARFALTPSWAVEGLGTLFEATGVFDSRTHTGPSERVNRARLADWHAFVARRKPGTLHDLVASDRLFSSDPASAYAEAWAVSFWLVETQPRKYSQYLALTAARPEFADYTESERLADFAAVFGSNFKLMEAQFLRYMQGMR